MSESTTTDTSDKTSETTSDSSDSESETESESSGGESTPKAGGGSGDEATVEQDTAETSTTPAADDESITTPQPTMTTTETTDQQVVVVTSEESAEPLFTLHLEDVSTDKSAAVVASTADIEQPAASLRAPQPTNETTAETTDETTVKDEKIARVIGQAKTDVSATKPELLTDESEVHRVYQRTVVQQSQVRYKPIIAKYCSQMT